MLTDINGAFLAEIAEYCERNRLEEWRYGALFARSHKLVDRLRSGIGIQSTSVAQILACAAEYEAAHPEPIRYRLTGRRIKAAAPLSVAA